MVYDTSNNPLSGQFRINFEDSEQGADYDMDAIIIYDFCVGSNCSPAVNANQVKITLTGQYAAGCIDQILGFVISGTTADGMYLPIKDMDVGNSTDSDTPAVIAGMPTTWTKTFTASGSSTTAQMLNSPLWYAAKWGGFNDVNGNGIPDLTSEWNQNGDSIPDTYFLATNPGNLETQLEKAIVSILARSSSGSAASVLSSNQGSGASLLQAVYFPKKTFTTTQILWTGMLENLWFYIDPTLQSSTIREDTNSDNILEINQDNIIQFYYDTSQNNTMAQLYYDSTGTGSQLTFEGIQTLDQLKYLWEAGKTLWLRNITTSPRKIYTYIPNPNAGNAGTTPPTQLNVSSNAFLTTNTNFTSANLPTILNVTTSTIATNIINYINGTDITGYRNRTVPITDSTGTHTYVWKLGDIINSTPRFVSWVPINNYAQPQTLGYADSTYTAFTKLSTYTGRGMAFVGANDGMLHAFNMGSVALSWVGQNPSKQMAKLLPTPDISGSTTGDFGKEMWAFIPYNALPYLQYIADPNYCHLYYVDGTPYIFDASIVGPTNSECPTCTKTASSWKTILIGSMRLGGACRNLGTACSDPAHANCVNTPVSNTGYSSYFALDITDPTNPIFLWEYPYVNQNVGFTTSGPAIVRIAAKNTDGSINTKANGYWFVVFGSGPTGYIDTTYNQFMAKSDKPLSIFVMDAYTGPNGIAGTSTSGVVSITFPTAINNAFAGSMINSTMDIVEHSNGLMDYQDEVLYLGYTTTADTTITSSSTWTKGGVIRLNTYRDTNPTNWVPSTVISGIGPVTSAVAHLQDVTNNLIWLFFGEGRFYYKTNAGIDDPTNQRKIYGINDPCFNKTSYDFVAKATGCPTALTATSTTIGQLDLSKTTGISASSYPNGWYALLSASSGSNSAERVITDPLAAASGSVYFTTFVPSADVCSFGGSTYLWALQYNTGASVSTQQKGSALMQVSTGSVQNLSLKTLFVNNGNRTSAAMTGMPPTGQGLTVVIPPMPVKQILHKIKK
ncbi:MAG: pilus assembly protein PilY, partial [Nitrospirae bacterium]|nr:pilus assembly protein PilY [Nitrospirota bacterium]